MALVTDGILGVDGNASGQRIRDNDTHHHGHAFVDKASTVVMENLDTRGMTRSAKGTKEAPGANVKQ